MLKLEKPIQARSLHQSGFALTELLLTIGIIAMVLSAIAAIAITTSAGQTAQSEARIIDSAANKIRSVYSSRPDFADLDLTATTNIEAWPTNMVAAPAEVYNAWGGAVTIAETPTQVSGQSTSRLFQIDTANVGQDACSELATANTSALGVVVGSTKVYERGSQDFDPVDAGLVAVECGDQATISFIYGKHG